MHRPLGTKIAHIFLNMLTHLCLPVYLPKRVEVQRYILFSWRCMFFRGKRLRQCLSPFSGCTKHPSVYVMFTLVHWPVPYIIHWIIHWKVLIEKISNILWMLNFSQNIIQWLELWLVQIMFWDLKSRNVDK